MQVVVAPFLVLRRLQVGNFVGVFFLFTLHTDEDSLASTSQFSFPESGSHQLR